MEHKGYIYMMTNVSNKVLYIGVTSDLKRRITEHKEGLASAFTRKYRCHKLVYYECFSDIEQAITREKRLKNYHRKWKDQLINGVNPEWRDLFEDIVLNPLIVEIPGQARNDDRKK